MESGRPNKGRAVAFLLAQVGAHAAKQFAERLSALKLSPPHAGILRRLSNAPAISQRELASSLGMHASRLVGVMDEMESLGLVVREDNPEDRRIYSLRITSHGREALAEISKVAMKHNDAICAALTEEERTVLAQLLQRIADQQQLLPGVHPGFSSLAGGDTGRPGRSIQAETKNEKGLVVSNLTED
jgi:DNA-binding MarR family transcriptional regulator